MDLAGWALYALSAAAALVMVVYLYGRREMPGRGRKLLGGLRWAALAILILLLFDPELSVPVLSGGRDRVQVLLDGSLSMGTPLAAGDSATRWGAAVEEARRVAGGGDVLVFGGAPQAVAADSLLERKPDAAASHLAPALRAAAEAGARKVLVLTDGGIDDLAEVNRLLPQLGLDLEVRSPGGAEFPNRAITTVEAPGWAEAGKPFEVRVGIGSGVAEGDSVRVVLSEGERVHAEAVVAAPQPGLEATAVLSFTPEAPAEGELVRYDLALSPGDAIPDDDRRSIYVTVADQPAGVALVSFRPDWELRFLQPVLEQALGLPVQGYLRAQGERFVRLGSGNEAGRSSSAEVVRRSVERADLVVLHGLDESAPTWAREAARSARRTLIFPAGAGGATLPLAVGAPAFGEWFLAGDVPASPVAELLAELRLDGLPPLTAVRPLELPAGAWAPLMASRDRSGSGATPLVVGSERDGRRSVVALADGFWRWAMRDGTGRQAYRRLWSALGGWLLEDDGLADDGPLRPLERVAQRGAALRWVAAGDATAAEGAAGAASDGGAAARDGAAGAPGGTTGGVAGGAESVADHAGPALDSVSLRVIDEGGAVAFETTLGVAPGDTLATPALPPGHYRYEVERLAAGDPAASGVFTVESYSPEYLRESVAIEEVAAAVAESQPVRRGPGRPLHTEPWPYLAFVLLVSTEWIFRRRWGLR